MNTMTRDMIIDAIVAGAVGLTPKFQETSTMLFMQR